MHRTACVLTALLLCLACFFPAMAAGLPQDLTVIEESAFEGDTSLEGVLALPEGTRQILANAFSGTGLFGLDVPSGVTILETQQLSSAAYVHIRGAETLVDGLTGMQYLIGPSGSAAAGWAQTHTVPFVAEEDLLLRDGFYYGLTENGWVLYSAADSAQVPDTLEIPARISGELVFSVADRAFLGCTALEAISAPSYLQGYVSAAAADCPQAQVTYYPWQDYYPVVSGIDFGGQQVRILDYWSGSGGRAENPSAAMAARYAYQDWINAVYNVDLNQVSGGDWGSIAQDLIDFAANPDGSLRIYILPPDFIGSVVSANALAPLDTRYVNLSAAKWNQADIRFMTRGGSVYGCSVGKSEPRQLLYFNKRVLEEAGIDWNSIYDMQAAGTWTWYNFDQMLSRIHRDTDGDGSPDVFGIVGSTDDLYMISVFSNDGCFFDYDENGALYPAMGSDSAMGGLTWARHIVQSYWAQRPENASWNWGNLAWTEGNTGFFIQQAYAGFSSSGFSGLEDEWGAVAFPLNNGGTGYVTITSNNLVVIPGCYDSETAARLLLLYDLWTDPNNGYSTTTSLSGYLNVTDSRAVYETYAMLQDTAHGRGDRTRMLGSTNDVLGGLLWRLEETAPGSLVQENMPFWQDLCSSFNDN